MAGEEIEQAADLLGRAYAEGELSEESTQALIAAGDVGTELGEALGDSGGSNDLLLVTILVDDSSSITEARYGPEAVRLGHNHCLEVLKEEAGREVLVHTRYLNKGSLSPYRELVSAAHLDVENFQPTVPKTPLYKQAVLTLGAVMVKLREQQERGRDVRAFTLLITDGGNNASGRTVVQHVRFLVQDMLEFSEHHIVAGMGIGSPDYFRRVFTEMGIPRQWILTPDATSDSIRNAFRKKVAPSLLRAAQDGDKGWRQLQAGPISDGG